LRPNISTLFLTIPTQLVRTFLRELCLLFSLPTLLSFVLVLLVLVRAFLAPGLLVDVRLLPRLVGLALRLGVSLLTFTFLSDFVELFFIYPPRL
jgi:hypothetical protein